MAKQRKHPQAQGENVRLRRAVDNLGGRVES